MNIKHIVFILTVILFSACSSEDSLDPNSIFDGNETHIENEFDVWIQANFVDVYNMVFNYRLVDKETDMEYNLAPADYTKSVALAKMTKHLWMGSYDELLDEHFMKTYCPKVMQLVGSPAYNNDGSVVLGTAEGGLKVTLYNVNTIDVNDIVIETLNEWYFKTMHHEFAHILHQTKEFTPDYAMVTPSNYQGASWLNLSDKEALDMGFVSPYASDKIEEDFVEVFSIYVTNTEEVWDAMVGGANDEGREFIEIKLGIVKAYMIDSWGIDMDELRAIIQERSAEIETWTVEDLTTLN